MALIRSICITILFFVLVGGANAGAVSSVTISPTAVDGVYIVTAADVNNAAGIDFSVSYDVTTLTNPTVTVTPGSFGSGANMISNTSTPGFIRVVFITGGAFKGTGGLLATITFTKVGTLTGRLSDFNASVYSTTGSQVAAQSITGISPSCSANQNFVDGKCVDTKPTCSDNQVLDKGVCVEKTPLACSADQFLINGICAAKPAFSVTALAGEGGSISPSGAQSVSSGSIRSFTLTPSSVYLLGNVSGCGGTLSGNVFTTGTINMDCTVMASFIQKDLPEPEVNTSPVVRPSQNTGSEDTNKPRGNMGTIFDQKNIQPISGSNMGEVVAPVDTTPQTVVQETRVVVQEPLKSEQKRNEPRRVEKKDYAPQGAVQARAQTSANTTVSSAPADSEKAQKAKSAKEALVLLKAVEMPVQRFREFKGARIVKNLASLFDASAARQAGIDQVPEIAVSDGKKKISVKIELAAAGMVPNFSLKGANLKSIKTIADKVWALDALPKKGKSDVRLSVLMGSEQADISLVVIPPLDAAVNKATQSLSEKGINALLAKGQSKGKLVYDLNNDGRQDYLDDYILVAHYLLKMQTQQPAQQKK